MVLRDQVLQDLGGVLEVRLVIFKLNPVDERGQLVDVLPGTFVVASEVLGQLLKGHRGQVRQTLTLTLTLNPTLNLP